jgi:hypothetical protein
MKHFISALLLLTPSAGGFSQANHETLILQNGKRFKGFTGRFAPDGLEFVIEKKRAKVFDAKKINMIVSDGRRHFPFASLHLFSGKNIPINTVRHDEKYVYFEAKGKNKERKLKRDKVFSYHFHEEEVVLYQETVFQGDTLTTGRVRAIVEGRQDARIYYKNPYTGLVNFGLGFVAGGMMNYWGVFIPAGYAGIYSSINPLKSKRKVRLLGPRYLSDNYYRYGFNSRAKGEKLKWSAGGGFTGIAIGVGILEYLKKYKPEVIDRIW